MYCNNCGASLPDGTKFCTNCGSDTTAAAKSTPAKPEYSTPQQHSGPYQQQPTYAAPIQGAHISRKTPIVAVLLSWLVLIGSGHIYAGKPKKGVGLIIGGLIFVGFIYGGAFAMFDSIMYYDFPVYAIVLLSIGSLGAIVLGLYSHIDAYRTATKYNEFIDRNGRAPTSADNW